MSAFLAEFADVAERLKPILQAHGVAAQLFKPGSGDVRGTPPPPRIRGYQNLEYVAAGGMGRVYKARHVALDRNVAVKILLEELAAEPELVERFLEEAQVAAQLDHPSIVHVHEVGKADDGRPYFSMQFVKGATLAQLLKAPPPDQDLARLLGYFEQICQGVAYAHAKGAVHRDLKPSNVMVRAFRHVTVMDWGLSKVLRRDAPTIPQPPEASSVVRVRPRAPRAASQPGGAVGTYAYMPPEQALGRQELVGPRSDVFSLGAILYQILTGSPPYSGRTADEVRVLAENAALGDAYAKLASYPDQALATIARKCLEKHPNDRYQTVTQLAEALEDYQRGIRRRLEAEQVERARAQAQIQQERKTRRWQVALVALAASFALILVGGAGIGAWAWEARKHAHRQKIDADVPRLDLLQEETQRLTEQGQYDKADAAAKEALSLLDKLESLADTAQLGIADRTALRNRRDKIAANRSSSDALAREARREAALQKSLEAADLEAGFRLTGLRLDTSTAPRLYEQAFQTYGMNLTDLDTAAKLRALPKPVREQILASFDQWGLLSLDKTRVLFALANRVDDDTWSQAVRAAWSERDFPALRTLAEAADTEKSIAGLLLLSRLLDASNEVNLAIAVLLRAQPLHADHFWVNLELANLLIRAGGGRQREAIGYFRAVLARSPRSAVAWNNLGQSFLLQFQAAEADEALTRALQEQPSCLPAWIGRVLIALVMQFDLGKARSVMNEVPDQFRNEPALLALDGLLLTVGDDTEGRKKGFEQLMRAARQAPPSQKPLVLMAQLIADMIHRNLREAANTCREIRKTNTFPDHTRLLAEGIEKLCEGRLPQAELSLRNSLEKFQDDPAGIHFRAMLTLVLLYQGRLKEAEEILGQAMTSAPQAMVLQHIRVALLMRQGRLDELTKVTQLLREARMDRPPGGPSTDLAHRMLKWMEGIPAQVNALDKGHLAPEAVNNLERSIVSEVALAMGKPYLAHRLALKEMVVNKAAAGFPERLVAELPSALGNDRLLQRFTYRFTAARAAIQAADGKGTERVKAPPEERPELRKRGIDLLIDELASQKKRAEQQPEVRPEVRLWLYYLERAPEFAAVRDVDRLPAEERANWKRFWVESREFLDLLESPSSM